LLGSWCGGVQQLGLVAKKLSAKAFVEAVQSRTDPQGGSAARPAPGEHRTHRIWRHLLQERFGEIEVRVRPARRLASSIPATIVPAAVPEQAGVDGEEARTRHPLTGK